MWRNVTQGKEERNKKNKKKPSKKQRRLSGDEQPPRNVNGHRDVSHRGSDAGARSSPVSDRRDPASSDRLDAHGEGHLRLLGPLPSLSPQNSGRRARQGDSDRPPESYRRLSDCEDDSQQPNGSAVPDTGKLAPVNQSALASAPPPVKNWRILLGQSLLTACPC